MPPLAPAANTSSVKDTNRGKLNQIVSTLSEDASNNGSDVVTALNAILSAISNKPSAS